MNNERQPVRGSTIQNVGAGMISFAAPFIILIATFALAGIAPFGSSTLLCRYNEQWFAELAQWRRVLDGSDGLMYTFAQGLGGDFFARWADGSCSPFLLIMMSMDAWSLPQAFTIVTLIRAAFAGVFAFLMLRRFSGRTPMSAAAFAVAYASGSQFVLSFLAPRYADAAVLLPLAAAGIALLAEKGRATLFFCGATAFLLCCGRLWPLLIFFSVAYFVWCQLVLGVHEGLWARMGLFAAPLAASVGAALVTLVPAFSGASDLSSAIYPVREMDTAEFFNIIGSMFSGAFTDGAVMPLLFCSSITILMVPLYLMNTRLPLGERQVCGLFLLLLTVSMCVPALCWLWLGFSVPTGAVTCCGSVFCLFAVSAAVRLTAQPMRVKVSKVLLAWMIIAGLFLSALIFGSIGFSLSGIIFTAAFMTMYAAITIIALSGHGISAGFCMVILICVGCECAVGGMLGLQSASGQIPLVQTLQLESENKTQQDLNAIITGSEQNGPSEFFRTRGAAVTGWNQADADVLYTSELTQLLDVMGISDGKGFTPVTDALFSIKYAVSDDSSDYPIVGITASHSVQRNDNVLGLCLSTPWNVRDLTSFSSNPFTAQNELISAMAGAERRLFIDAALTGREGEGLSIIETLDGVELVRSAETGIARFTVLVPADGPLYMYLGSRSHQPTSVMVNNSVLAPMDLSAVVFLGRFERGTQLTVTIPMADERLMLKGTWFAVLDTALTDTAMAQLAQQKASYITVKENTVTCTATVSEGQVLMTTIPWQSGWKAYANGNEVEVICASGALLGVNTGPGIHDIRLVYQPEDFSTYLLLSAVFMFSGFLLTCILDSDRINRIYEYSRSLAGHQTAPPPEEDIFATYSDYMIPDIQSLDDQDDDFSDYFNGM